MEIFLAAFSFLTLLTLPPLSTTKGIAQPKHLVAKLIHRDSISSPHYMPNDTITNRAKRTIESSIARFAYLDEISALASDEIIQTYLVPVKNTPLLYVSFSIGQPPIPQLAIMDTGSNLLWVRCLPCTPCPQKTRIYNPSKSSTYYILPCRSFICETGMCNSFNQCAYDIAYLKGPSSTGVLSREKLTFENDEGEVAVHNVSFGCGHENGDFKDEDFCGVFGLGPKNSLVLQLGSKFSYCIGNVMDPDYSYHRLTLGDGAYLNGDSTPLKIINGRYYVTMEGISIGGARLDLDPLIFRNEVWPRNGVIIDSGSSLNLIAKRAYKVLRKRIEYLLDGVLKRVYVETMPLCYEGVVKTYLPGFPVITFHFADGAELDLDFQSSFLQFSPSEICVNFLPGDFINKANENLTIIGIMAQQNYNVGYDINSRRLFFENIDCELLNE